MKKSKESDDELVTQDGNENGTSIKEMPLIRIAGTIRRNWKNHENSIGKNVGFRFPILPQLSFTGL